MGFVNKVMLMGHTTRAPDMRKPASGTSVCEFGLATNRVFKTTSGQERRETVFVECTAFGRQAEVLAEFCEKGRAIFVEGRLHFETWQDKGGQRQSRLSVIVESFQLLGESRSHVGAGDAGQNVARNVPAAPRAVATTAAPRGRVLAVA